MTRGHDHYLAATHLRGFSFDGKRLWQLDLRTHQMAIIGVRDAGVERGLNTLMRDGLIDRDLEGYMDRSNEQPAAPILARLRDGPTGPVELDPSENAALARYIALTYGRSPRARERTQEHARNEARRLARDLSDPAALERRLRAAGVRADPLAAEVVRLRSVVQLRQGIIPNGVQPWALAVGIAVTRPPVFIGAMQKFVIRRERDPYMVLGDCAVVLLHDGAYWEWGALGFATSPQVRVVVPLSPSSFLICGVLDPPRIEGLVTHWRSDDFASFVNRASLDHAARFVFGRDPQHLERGRADLLAATA